MPEPGSTEPVSRGLTRIIAAGSALTGAMGGAGITLLTGDPFAGAAAGTALTHSLQWGGTELAQRQLSEREEVRVGAALAWAAKRYEEHRAADEEMRTDGWFDQAPTGRSAADELVEGVLLAAQREHEEHKVQFMGYLLTNFAFYHQIDRYHANRLLRLAERLSWQQLCLLALVEKKDRFTLTSDGSYARRGEAVDYSIVGVYGDLEELGYAKLEMVGNAPQTRHDPTPIGSPAALVLLGEGQLLYTLMNLDRIPEQDLQRLAHHLRPRGSGAGESDSE